MIMPSTQAAAGFSPRMESTHEPLNLAMQRLWLTGRLLPVGARLWVEHEFQSGESKPVEVIYSFALPRDAALRRFRIRGEDFAVDSELRATAEAVRVYEEGIRAGSLASLARQYGDGLVNLTVGNIRPEEKVTVRLEMLAGVELHDRSFRFRFPFTLAPAYHPKARAIEAVPGTGELELPPDEFGDLILPQFVKDSGHLHQAGFCLEINAGEVEEIGSPSHTLRVQKKDDGQASVSLAREADLPDRDLVLDVRTSAAGATVLSGADRSGRGRFAVVVPSTEFEAEPSGPRRAVILLDRSGSMAGVPLKQARKAIEACLAALDPADQFGLVAFNDQTEVFKKKLCDGSANNRSAARKFLDGIEARGGTELASGVEAAAKLLGREQGDILILTDGQVFGTEAILERVRSTEARVHCLGIGSASQDRFLAQLAGQTGGVSRFLTPHERVDLPAVELFAAVGRPVAEGIRASVDGADGWRVAPEPARFVHQGTPLLVMGETSSAVDAPLRIHWQDGRKHLTFPLSFAANPLADTLKLLQGSRIISDLESRLLPAERHGAAGRRESSRAAELLKDLAGEFGLGNSQMSLVAVVNRAGDVTGEIPTTLVVPVGMPQDTLFGSYFARLSAPAPRAAMASFDLRTGAFWGEVDEAGTKARSLSRKVFEAFHVPKQRTADEFLYSTQAAESVEDQQIRLAAMLEPDGGMPGRTDEARIANSLAALFFFLGQGSTRDAGPFRLHVDRLLRYLDPQRLKSLGPDHSLCASRAVVLAAGGGRALKVDCTPHARTLASGGNIDYGAFWRDLDSALAVGKGQSQPEAGTKTFGSPRD